MPFRAAFIVDMALVILDSGEGGKKERQGGKETDGRRGYEHHSLNQTQASRAPTSPKVLGPGLCVNVGWSGFRRVEN
jgi:hypothetical protein